MTIIETDPAYQDPDGPLRDLLERQHLILAMQDTQGWHLWKDYLAACAVGYQRRLLGGTHKDLLDYRYDAGVLYGIQLALNVDTALARKASGLRRILQEETAPDGGILATEDTA